jgi:hypothetical protein
MQKTIDVSNFESDLIVYHDGDAEPTPTGTEYPAQESQRGILVDENLKRANWAQSWFNYLSFQSQIPDERSQGECW